MTTIAAAAATAPSRVPSRGLHFAAGIPGFPNAHHFGVSRWGTEPSPFLVLECTEIEGLRFVAAQPAIFFPWYEPTFGAEVYQALGVGGRDEVDVLAILTLHSRPEDTTFNLLGPIVVNAATGDAVQAVLSGSGYDPRTPILAPSGPA
jgi:flagellar assembly factor FliW